MPRNSASPAASPNAISVNESCGHGVADELFDREHPVHRRFGRDFVERGRAPRARCSSARDVLQHVGRRAHGARARGSATPAGSRRSGPASSSEIALANVLDDADDGLRASRTWLNVSRLPSGSSPGQRRSAVDCETMTWPGFSLLLGFREVFGRAAARCPSLRSSRRRRTSRPASTPRGVRRRRRSRREARSRKPLVQRKVLDDPDGFDAGQRRAAAP